MSFDSTTHVQLIVRR